MPKHQKPSIVEPKPKQRPEPDVRPGTCILPGAINYFREGDSPMFLVGWGEWIETTYTPAKGWRTRRHRAR